MASKPFAFTFLTLCGTLAGTMTLAQAAAGSSRVIAATGGLARSAYPVARHAKPTYGPDYGYGWVGGGAPSWRGEPRRVNEGVWGRDYVGVLYLRRVWPNWWHGQRQQGGAGAYRTDGPRLLPPR